MNPQLAETVLFAITGVAVVVWLIAARFTWRATKPPDLESAEELVDDGGVPLAPEERAFSGTAEVALGAADLSRKAATYVAQGKLGVVSKIVAQDEGELRFEPLSAGVWSPFRRVRLAFAPLGSQRTEVHYEIVYPRGRGWGLLWGAWLFLALGLTAIGVGFWLVRTYIVANPNPDVRWQVFQMFQVAHFVWPPFLFAALYRAAGRTGRVWSENVIGALIHNLPYLE
jgi:hypothetical protein